MNSGDDEEFDPTTPEEPVIEGVSPDADPGAGKHHDHEPNHFDLSHEPDQAAREAAAADDAARAAGYSGEALETLRMVTASDDEITDEQRAVRDKTARSMMLVGIRTIVIRALGLMGTIVLARLLSPEDYGTVAIGLTIVIVGRFMADGGLGPGLIRREKPPEKFEYAALLAFQQSVVWPVFLLGTLCAFTVMEGSLGGLDGALTFSMMLGALVIDVMRSPNAIGAERELEYTPVIRAEIIEFLIYNIFAIGLVVGGMGIVGVGVANLLRAVTGSGLLILTGPVGWVWPKWNWPVVRGIAKFGAYFQASWLATLFRDQGLATILFAISGAAALGAFDQARRLLVVVTLVFESAWRVGLPGLARMMEAGAAPKMLFTRGLGLAGVAMAFPVVALVASCNWLVPFLLGPGWDETADLIPWVGAAIMVTIPIATIITTLLWAQDEPKKVFIMGIPALAGTLGFGALAMTKYDAVGAGIGLFVGGLIYVASCVYYAHDVFGPSSIGKFGGPILASIGGVAAGFLAAEAVGGGNLVGVLVSGFVGVAALIVCLMLFARASTYDLVRFMGKATG